MLQFMNKVELCGIVGFARQSKVSDIVITNFTLATTSVTKNTNKDAVCETTWHNVTYFSSEALEIEKGNVVSVIGRIRNNNYTDSDGVRRYSTDICASHVEVHKDVKKLEDDINSK